MYGWEGSASAAAAIFGRTDSSFIGHTDLQQPPLMTQQSITPEIIGALKREYLEEDHSCHNYCMIVLLYTAIHKGCTQL